MSEGVPPRPAPWPDAMAEGCAQSRDCSLLAAGVAFPFRMLQNDQKKWGLSAQMFAR